jgi:hypothetical protein
MSDMNSLVNLRNLKRNKYNYRFVKNLNNIVLFLIASILLLCASNIQWSKNNWSAIIEADGKGYYAYLPATFIYNDLNFTFFDSIEKKYPNPRLYYDYRVGEKGREVNKYFAGTAIAMFPFFMSAHVTSMMTGFDADGYSKLYPIMINVAAIFYLILGLFYLKKILLHYNASNKQSAFIIVAITFATNLFYYAVCEPAMSHVYSFGFVTMFIHYALRFFAQPSSRIYFILCVLLGLIVLIRPVNGLTLLIIPFLAGNYKTLLSGIQYLKMNFLNTTVGVLITIIIVFIQFLIYKIQTGNFFVDSYPSESFHFASPHIIDFLLSYKKGLFIYTPIVFISLFGAYYLFKKNKFQLYTLLGFIVVLVYVLSSWWNWWYGGSFATRVFVEYYAVVALLLLFAYQALQQRWKRNIYSAIIVITLLICQVQTYQYRYYVIHWEKMDKEHYWRVFLQLNKLGENNPNKDLLE